MEPSQKFGKVKQEYLTKHTHENVNFNFFVYVML